MSMLGRLLIGLGADTVEFESDMGRAARIAEKEMERMVTRAAVAGELIGRALGAAANAFMNLARETVDLGDELAKFSQRSNFSVERLSELHYGAKLADVSLSQLKTGLKFFNEQLVKAQKETSVQAELFRALGVDITQGPQVAFEQFASAINALPDGETKVAIMRKGFTGVGDALIPLLANLDQTTDKARALGQVMSTKAAKDAERFKDAMTEMQAAMTPIVLAMTPTVSGFATLAENFNRARESGQALKGFFIELGSVIMATFGSLNAFNNAIAEKWFEAVDKLRPGGASPAGAGAGAAGGEGGAPNPAQAACAVTGGKWVNGRCQYGADKSAAQRKKALEEYINLTERLTKAEEDHAQEVAQAWSYVPSMEARLKEHQKFVDMWTDADFTDMTLEQIRLYHKLRLEGLDTLEAMAIVNGQLKAGFDGMGRSLGQQLTEMGEFAREAARGIQSGLSDGLFDVMQGNFDSMGDRFKAMLDRMVADVLAAKLAAKLFGDMDRTGNIGGWVGEVIKAFQGGSAVSAGFGEAGALVATASGLVPALAEGTDYVPRTGLYQLHEGERVVPAAENNRWGGGMTVVNHFHVAGPVDRRSQAQIAAAAGEGVQRALARNS